MPAGTTTGGGGAGAAAGAGDAGVALEPVAFPLLPPVPFDPAVLEELEAVSAGLFEQATSVSKRKIDNAWSARVRIISSSKIKIVFAKTVIQEGRVCKRNKRN